MADLSTHCENVFCFSLLTKTFSSGVIIVSLLQKFPRGWPRVILFWLPTQKLPVVGEGQQVIN